MVDTLTKEEIRSSVQNADLRKKLRVDRARKLAKGPTTTPKNFSTVEDPNQPDWMKHKALRDV